MVFGRYLREGFKKKAGRVGSCGAPYFPLKNTVFCLIFFSSNFVWGDPSQFESIRQVSEDTYYTEGVRRLVENFTLFKSSLSSGWAN